MAGAVDPGLGTSDVYNRRLIFAKRTAANFYPDNIDNLIFIRVYFNLRVSQPFIYMTGGTSRS